MVPSANRLVVIAALALVVVMPLAFRDDAGRALAALHLSGPAALLFLVTAILCRAVCIRVVPVTGVLRALRAWPAPGLVRVTATGPSRTPAPLAVSVGGCLVPCALVTYEALALQQQGVSLALPALAVLVTTAVCYALARPHTGVGAPADITAFVAACAALNLAPDHAVPVACTAGTLGPLLGAELLHLRDQVRPGHGVAGLGGTATFDGILLSCLVAVWLA